MQRDHYYLDIYQLSTAALHKKSQVRKCQKKLKAWKTFSVFLFANIICVLFPPENSWHHQHYKKGFLELRFLYFSVLSFVIPNTTNTLGINYCYSIQFTICRKNPCLFTLRSKLCPKMIGELVFLLHHDHFTYKLEQSSAKCTPNNICV